MKNIKLEQGFNYIAGFQDSQGWFRGTKSFLFSEKKAMTVSDEEASTNSVLAAVVS